MHPATGQPPGNNEQEAAPSLQRFGTQSATLRQPAASALSTSKHRTGHRTE